MKESLTEPKDIFFAHSAGAQEGSGEGSFDLVSCLRKNYRVFMKFTFL